MAIQVIQSPVPQLAIRLEPVGRVLHCHCPQTARTPLRIAFRRLDQPSFLEHLEVLRDGGLADPEWLAQLEHTRFPPREPRDNGPARGVPQGREDRAQRIRLLDVHSHIAICTYGYG